MSRSLRRNRFDSGTSPKAMDLSKPTTSSNNSSSLLRQNQELQHRLQEDAALYRRRLDTYKQAQQNQAALVARLQSKVLQYKKKCNELEDRMCDTPDPSDHGRPIKVILLFFVDLSIEFIIIIKYLVSKAMPG